MTVALRQELLKLSAEEKLQIIGELWDSLDDAQMPELTPAQKAELKRRVREHELHPEAAVPWETVKAELRRRRK
jgi:putative addiction module component (TIGR02574 family)